MRVYVAGPMTGYPDSNYPAFDAAARTLRGLGVTVENPAENPAPACGSWRAYMALAVAQLARCDCVVLLPGWERSKGARVEFDLARGLDMQTITLDGLLSVLQESGSRNLDATLGVGRARRCSPAPTTGVIPG